MRAAAQRPVRKLNGSSGSEGAREGGGGGEELEESGLQKSYFLKLREDMWEL